MKKNTKKQVREDNNKALKLFGALVNLLGLAGYSLANTIIAVKSVLKINDITHFSLEEAVERVVKANFLESSLILGDVVLFEFLNYYLYLNRKRDLLLAFVAFEVMAFLVAAYVFGFGYILSYAALIPAVTGFINYVILVDEGE